jgi:hypothetical protein
MSKGTITISVPNGTTHEEIKQIRNEYKQSEHYKDYKLNIIISGEDDIKKALSRFLAERIKK